ncbi:MAG: hypothetical protein AB7F41_05635 [Methylocystis sp.]|uniref:hypothetical protein n=1 Tax=Methylocystis sp. TaxID=1911079 RepID=UPI003D151B4C
MRVLALALAVCVAAQGANAEQARSQKAKPKSDSAAALSGPVGDPNGRWIVDATTTVGQCQSLIPQSIEIAGNKIIAATGPAVSSWGYVDDEGTIVARFTGDGQRIARFNGTLRGGRGAGPWSSSTDLCGGTWRASRSDAAAQ